MNSTFVTESFSAAVKRCFHSAEDLRCAAASALERQPNSRLFLAAWGNELHLLTTKDGKIPRAEILFHIPPTQTQDASLFQLQWNVIDWRFCEAKWNEYLSRCPLYPI